MPTGAFDILPVLSPAPPIGGARDKTDRAIFRATRKLAGTPRWQMATNDVKLSAGDMLSDDSCMVRREPSAAQPDAQMCAREAELVGMPIV